MSKDCLESKVMKFENKNIKEDKNGTYFPFCSFGYHRGLILDENVCKSRDCDYYTKIYIRYGKSKRKHI